MIFLKHSICEFARAKGYHNMEVTVHSKVLHSKGQMNPMSYKARLDTYIYFGYFS